MNNLYRREHRVAATTRNYGEFQIIVTVISITPVLPLASFGDGDSAATENGCHYSVRLTRCRRE